MEFDKLAKTWDSEDRLERAKITAELIANALPGGPIASALDFGCATGLVSFYLADKFERITLVDASQGMIDVLRERIAAAGSETMTALRHDVLEEGVLDEPFDIVYTSLALHHIIDTEKALRSLYAMLKPGGSLFIAELATDDGSFHANFPNFTGHNGFDQDELMALLQRIGFIDTSSRVFLKGKNSHGAKSSFELFFMRAKKP